MDYQEAINKANQQISEKMKREIFERLSISHIDTMHKCDGSISAHEAIVSAVDEARRCRMYEKMEEASGLKKFYEEVYPQVQENLRMLVEYQKIGLSPKQVADTICELSATKRVLGHYQQLGDLEEVREAVEKQKRKKPCASNRCYVCPHCGLVTSLKIKHNYCDACGQHIDWSEKESQTPYHPDKCHGCFGAANNDCERCTR